MLAALPAAAIYDKVKFASLGQQTKAKTLIAHAVADEGRRRSPSRPTLHLQALRPDIVSGRRRLSLAWLATLPFFAYAIAVPVPAGRLGARRRVPGQSTDHATLSNIRLLFQHPYIDAYRESIEISLVTALLGGIFGLLIAYAAIRDGTPRWIRRSVLTTFSGVAANFGGIPLAFAFIATLGPLGIVTTWLRNARLRPDRATASSSSRRRGVELAYMYFQLPLMILVIAPAIDGLQAASGARRPPTSAPSSGSSGATSASRC